VSTFVIVIDHDDTMFYVYVLDLCAMLYYTILSTNHDYDNSSCARVVQHDISKSRYKWLCWVSNTRLTKRRYELRRKWFLAR
jgi:hypothetical protein